MFSIGEPTTKDKEKSVEAPRRVYDGTITAAQQEQKGCGTA
jgi:hypothetical protein